MTLEVISTVQILEVGIDFDILIISSKGFKINSLYFTFLLWLRSQQKGTHHKPVVNILICGTEFVVVSYTEKYIYHHVYLLDDLIHQEVYFLFEILIKETQLWILLICMKPYDPIYKQNFKLDWSRQRKLNFSSSFSLFFLTLSSFFFSFFNLIFESEMLRGSQKCFPLSSRTSRSVWKV